MPSKEVRAEEMLLVERTIRTRELHRELGGGVVTFGGKGKKLGRPAGAMMLKKQDEADARYERRFLVR